jgi:two-component system phosphate regulon sensor histidine kinase PhoR
MQSLTFRRFLLTSLIALVIAGVSADGLLVRARAANPAAIHAALATAVIAAALAAVGVAYLVALPQVHRLRRLKRIADGLLAGPVEAPSGAAAHDELAALEASLGAVAQQIHALVARSKLESGRREAILSGMAEGVLAVDRELRVVFSNDAVLRALGARSPVAERTRLLELVRDRELCDLLHAAVRTGETQKRRLKLAGERERLFEVQAAPFEMPGGEGAIAILHDITDLERLEQVRKDFVANVSHEMRTPLAGIIGYAETLLDGALEDSANNRRFVSIIRANAVRLNSIASDLLVLSELESKIDPPEPERLSVREVVESVLSTLHHEALAREVTIVRQALPDAYVLGTRLRLEQALLNLVVNAIKFNKRGGEVRIGARVEGARVAISIADTGVGIPSRDLPRIFERFYRVDKGRSREVGGTGLGLTIVKYVVERMNGTIEVRSELRAGSEFIVSLPAAPPTL